MENKQITIAIVGGGYVMVTALYHISKIISSTDKLVILIFEKRNRFGDGICFNKDIQQVRFNVPSSILGVDGGKKDEFVQWLTQKYSKEADFLEERYLFGNYLIEKCTDLISELTIKGHSFQLIPEEVIDIYKKENNYIITTLLKKVYTASYLLITAGINEFKNVLKIDSFHHHYIHNPYTKPDQIEQIKPQDNLLIIGTSTTCWDVLIRLQSQQHVGKVYLYADSRSLAIKDFPQLQSDPEFLIFNKEHGAPLNLSQVVTLLVSKAKELYKKYPSSSLLQHKVPIQISAIEKQLEHQKKDIFLTLIRTNFSYLENIWQGLSDPDQKKFGQKYQRMFRKMMITCPPDIYSLIVNELKKDRIRPYKKNISHVATMPSSFLINQDIELQWIINATGPHTDIKHSKLYNNLFNNRILIKNNLGGLKVAPHTLRLINEENKNIGNAWALSPAIFGSIYFIYNVAILSQLSKKMIEDLYQQIKIDKR